MEKQNKKNQDTLVKSVCMIVAVLAFIGGFALSSELKERIYRSNENNKKTNDDDVVAAAQSLTVLGFDQNYIDSDDQYRLILGTYAGNNDSYFTLQYGNALNEVKMIRYYYDNDNTEEYTLQFNQDVVDVYLAAFSSDPTLNSVLFLLDNGDVAYGFVDELSSELPTYTIIDSLSNIVKFYSANNCNAENYECNETTLAQSTDKTIYDLYYYIVK